MEHNFRNVWTRCTAAILLWATAAGAQDAAAWEMYLRRVGPLTIGMRLDEVRLLLNDYETQLEAPEHPEECAHFPSLKLPEGVSLMIIRGRLARVDIYSPAIKTASGVGVGDDEGKIEQTYPGRIRSREHPYDGDAGKYFIFTPRDRVDRGFGIIFETYEGKVTSMRTGTQEAVPLIEGCS